jgi:hypothetical protein
MNTWHYAWLGALTGFVVALCLTQKWQQNAIEVLQKTVTQLSIVNSKSQITNRLATENTEITEKGN